MSREHSSSVYLFGLVVVFFLAGYLVSPPFVLRATFPLNSVAVDEAVRTFYAPAEWLADRVPLYHDLIKYFMHSS